MIKKRIKNKIFVLGRRELAELIHLRLGWAVPYRTVRTAVNIILKAMMADLLADRIINVRCFGTFSPYRTSYGCSEHSRISVRFHPHDAFKRLLSVRRSRFLVKRPEKAESEKTS